MMEWSLNPGLGSFDFDTLSGFKVGIIMIQISSLT